MAITARQLVNMTGEDVRKMFDKPLGLCIYSKCRQEVRGSQGYRAVPSGIYHTDCYWNEWGDEVEKHPISSPGRRGIGGIMLDDSDLEFLSERGNH